MANVIRIKRRAAGGAAGAPATLKNAELAYNEQDDTLYYGKGADGSANATSIIPIAGPGGFVDKTTDQTIGGNKTFSNTVTASISGNAGTATKWLNARSISISGDLTWTVNVDGSGNATAAGTLATVNANVGTFTKLTVNAKGLVTAAVAAVLGDIGTPTADYSFGGYKLTNLADPASAQDAATKAYVDSVAQGLDAKASVRAASTGNLTLSGTQTIDGVAVIAADRVLVKNQTDPTQNGIYVVAAGAWSRSTDADSWNELISAFVFVEEGTANADSGWVSTVNAGGTIGVTNVTWTQFSAAGSYTAGNGLQLSGGQFSIKHDGATLTSSGAGLKLSDTYAGQTSITTLGTIGTGTWQGTAVGVGYGGTGQTSFTSKGIIYGNGGGGLLVTAAGAWDAGNSIGQILSVDSNGVPAWTNNIDCGTF